MAGHDERYVLERRLAIGGMAEIFLGRVAGLEGFEKKVVLKRMLPSFEDRPDFVEMFLDEARLAGRFNHPNLVMVHELTKIDGLYCLAMEYIEGEDLDSVLDACDRRDRFLDIEVAAYLVAEVADALHYAHELTTEDGQPLNVVHRDISPANIIVTNHGGVKLVDFGIAKSEAGRTQTQTGIVKGKFSYMSPEQILGKRLDRRSDIFSLGAVLYEALTLERCFRRDTPMDTVRAITRGELVPIRKSRPEVPDELAAIVHRMLALERDDRHSSAASVSRDLRSFLDQRQSPNPATIRALMRELFEATKIRGYSAIGGRETVEVSGELAGPEVSVSEAVYREMVEQSQADGTVTVPESDRDVPITSPAAITDLDLVGASTTPDVIGGSTTLDIEPTAIVQREPTREKSTRARSPWWRQPWAWAAVLAPAIGVFMAVVVFRSPDSHVEQLPPVPPTQTSVIAADPEPEPEVAPEPIAAEPEPEPAPEAPVEPVASPEPPRAAPEPGENPGARPARGTLTVTSKPRVVVFIDGRRIGATPQTIPLPPGRHKMRVTSDDGIDRAIPIRVRSNQTVRKALSFGKGTVMVKSTPWAQVYLRGKKLGSTPLVKELYEGNYTLRLVSPSSGVEKAVKITVKPGQKTKVDEKF